MKIIVDVELRESAMNLILQHINEERSKNKSEMREGGLEESVQRYLTIFQEVIQKRLREWSNQNTKYDLINQVNVLMKEEKTLDISDPPTKTQLLIIKSFLKVIYHQFYTNRNDFHSNEGNHNLLFSIFVNKIVLEESTNELQDQGIFIESNIPLASIITSLLTGTENKKREIIHSFDGDCRYCFYVLPKTNTFLSPNNFLSEEFTKIDIEDKNINNNVTPNLNNIDESTFLTDIDDISQQFSSDTLQHITVSTLPCQKFEGLWENLFFEKDIKGKLFNYGEFSMKIANHLKFSNYKNESSNILVNNKIILLHGPPGTGKTTLCQGLSQKMIIRKKHATIVDSVRSQCKGLLIELSCSRMFSRWFGESSKNLECIFNDLRKILSSPEYENYFLFLLIDEIETIAGSRKDILSKNESSDSVRVVNTLLTQIDSLKSYPNFLILTTSNLATCLDPAFLDRVDENFFIENPSVKSVSNILISIVNSLFDIEIIISKKHSNSRIEEKYLKIIDILAQECVVCIHILN